MHRFIPHERYAGAVPSPVAVYRPGNIFGGGDIGASNLGVAHFTVTELADTYESKATALKTYMDEHVKKATDGTPEKDKDGRPVYDLDAEGVKKAREMNADLNTAHDAWKGAKEVSDIGANAEAGTKRARPEAGRKIIDGADMSEARPARRPSIKALLEESDDLKAIQSGDRKTGLLFEIDDPDAANDFLGVKTTLLLTDIAPLADRQPQLIPSAQNRIMVSDLMAAGTTDSNTVTYYEETTFTNAAVETAENVAKPESTLDFTERTDTVRKIATWIPISDEALNDNRQLRSYVEGRLIYMVRQREEGQLITGNGTPPNIQGILNRSGIQTQAKGSDPVPDAFFKAFIKVQVTGDADPDGFVIHPNDWADVRLLRTIDGIYIWGNPSEDAAVRMWGYPGRVTTGITEGTGLTGAFRTFAQVFRREGLRVEASTEHASYFIENKVALLAETRLALAVYRPAAFCSVTGI